MWEISLRLPFEEADDKNLSRYSPLFSLHLTYDNTENLSSPPLYYSDFDHGSIGWEDRDALVELA